MLPIDKFEKAIIKFSVKEALDYFATPETEHHLWGDKWVREVAKEGKRKDRKIILLGAALDILKKVDQSPYVISALETTAIWDDAECDGMCLMAEIEELLSSPPEN